MEVENGPLEDHEIHYKQVVFHFHVSSRESSGGLIDYQVEYFMSQNESKTTVKKHPVCGGWSSYSSGLATDQNPVVSPLKYTPCDITFYDKWVTISLYTTSQSLVHTEDLLQALVAPKESPKKS